LLDAKKAEKDQNEKSQKSLNKNNGPGVRVRK